MASGKIAARIDAIKKRQPTLEKWITNYDDCTFEEDKMCGSAFDPMVADLKFLLNHIDNLEMVCRRLAAAKKIESRDRIAKQCHHLFAGSPLRSANGTTKTKPSTPA